MCGARHVDMFDKNKTNNMRRPCKENSNTRVAIKQRMKETMGITSHFTICQQATGGRFIETIITYVELLDIIKEGKR